MFGYTPEEWTSDPDLFVRIVHPDDRERVLGGFERWHHQGDHYTFVYRIIAKDGRIVWVSDHAIAERDENGVAIHARGFLVDITRQKEAELALRRSEEQLRTAAKMEAVGRLAGGVAHDFNNLLTVISGHAELGLARPEGSDRASNDFVQIREAAERAAALTRQLLAFSRKQVLKPAVISPDAVVTTLEPMLRRLIGEDVRLVVSVGARGAHVLADKGQLEQVLVNLVVNARDAMPDGGSIAIATSAVDLDAPPGDGTGGPGRFVRLTVSDTGTGMDAETREHIFEPFFTTKPAGEGTGLGLATVHGIVEQSGGHVAVDSEPGHGACFVIHLPAVGAAELGATAPVASPVGAGGAETVLLVEDESALRALMLRILADRGYRVLAAASGDEALSVEAGHEGPIDLLLTDVVMPGMSGSALAAELAARRPGLRILYMSGYTDDAVLRHGISHAETEFIQKPFTPEGLARRVREVIDVPMRAV
jgi:PAS domain S-box-containing protein